MELVPWKPFGKEFGALRREMDDLWNRFIGETSPAKRVSGAWCPSVDLSETKDGFILKAELPGLDAKDIDVSLSGNILTIKGERKKEEEKKDEHHHYVERSYGSFQRSFQLPVEVNGDKIEATFDKGILKVTLPKVQEARKKEIEIKVK